jgi:ABC-type lipoprotein release transport system permease subunit
MNIKKKVLVIVIAFFAIIGIVFAVLIGIYYYMSYTMQQEIRESMSRSDSPNPSIERKM